MSDLSRDFVEMNADEKAALKRDHEVAIYIGDLRSKLERSGDAMDDVLAKLQEIASRPNMNEQIVRSKFRTDVGRGTVWQERIDAVAAQL